MSANLPAIQQPVAASLVKAPSMGQKIVQKGLLVTTLFFSVLSLIPPLRLAGGLGLRSTAVLSSTAMGVSYWKNMSGMEKALACSKIAICALGLAGLAAGLPALIVASVAADIALNVFEMVKAAVNGQTEKALMHFGFTVINTLVLGGLLAGSWQLMVTAAAVSALAMAGIAIKVMSTAKSGDEAIDVLCYLGLMATGIAGAVTTANVAKPRYTKSYFEVTNTGPRYNYPGKIVDHANYYDANGNLLGSAKYGATLRFALPYQDTVQYGNSESSIKALYFTANNELIGSNGHTDYIYIRATQVEGYNPTLPSMFLETVPLTVVDKETA